MSAGDKLPVSEHDREQARDPDCYCARAGLGYSCAASAGELCQQQGPEVEPFDAFVRRVVAPSYAGLILAELARWEAAERTAAERYAEQREENFALVDAMRNARALLHGVRPQAMSAAVILGDALQRRAEAMLGTDEEAQDAG